MTENRDIITIQDSLDTIIDRMRVTSTVLNIVETPVPGSNNSVYQITHEPYTSNVLGYPTITSYNLIDRDVLRLKEGNTTQITISGQSSPFFVKAGNVDFDNNTFEVVLRSGLSTDQNDWTWKRNAPYFEYGHLPEISSILDKMKTIESFPFIWLQMDVQASVNSSMYHSEYNSIIIDFLHGTDKDYSSRLRDQNVYLPILLPLYYSFIDMLEKANDIFSWPLEVDERKVQRNETQAFRFGSRYNVFGGNDKNKFNVYVDAVEIDISNFKINNKSAICG